MVLNGALLAAAENQLGTSNALRPPERFMKGLQVGGRAHGQADLCRLADCLKLLGSRHHLAADARRAAGSP